MIDFKKWNVPRETSDRLNIYCDLLKKWQRHINLVAASTLGDWENRHFLDSYQLLPLIKRTDDTLIDIGSGAGFPGMILAMAGLKKVCLIESDKRKVAFLREVAQQTHTDVVIYESRVEQMEAFPAETVTARACAPLKALCSLAYPFLTPTTICFFHKGENYSMEIEEAARRWSFHYEVVPSRAAAFGVIIKLWSLEPL